MVEPALLIALPLATSLLCLPLGRHAARLVFVVAPASLVLTLLLAVAVRAGGVAKVALGGWDAPLGIVLRVDGVAAVFLCMSTLVASATGFFAVRDLAASGETRRGFAFWPLFFALWGALNAVFLGGDLFNLYVALELVTLAAIALVALEGRPANLAAAMRYFLFASFGSLAFLIGAALVYGVHGTLDTDLVASSLVPAPGTYAAAALMTVGLFAKAALFPFHAWLPPAHAGAPAPASALLSALVVKAAVYVLYRLWFDVLPPLSTPAVNDLLGVFGATAVLFGSAAALRQERLKRIVAYSTVAHVGYLFLVFPLAGDAGIAAATRSLAWSGAVFHAVSHGLAKASLFLAAGAIMRSAGSDRLADLEGVGRSAPVATFAFALSAVSLMGLPPSGGFLAKYLMLTASFAEGRWWWGAVLIAGGLLSAGYLFRPMNRLVAKRPAEAPPLSPVGRSLETMPLLLAVAAALLGIASIEPYRLLQVGAPIVGVAP
jgi:multicomponent Na+:H+ antiporter subunit D